MLNAVALFGALGVIEALGSTDKVAGYAAYAVKFNGDPPKTLACLAVAHAVELGFFNGSSGLFLNLLYFGKNKAFRQLIGIDYNGIHCSASFRFYDIYKM